MIDQSQIRRFYDCQKYVPSQRELFKLRDNIYTLLPVSRCMVERYGIESPDDLKAYINNFAQIIFDDFSKTGYIDSRLYEIQAIEDILKNPSIINKEYSKVKDIPNNHVVYTADSARTQKYVLVNAIDEISKLENYAKKLDITSATKLNNIVIHEDDSTETRKMLKLIINVLKQNNIKDKMLVMLKAQKEESERFVREHQITSIKSMYDFLFSLGLLGPYFSSYESTSKKFGFSDLEYEFSTNSTDKDSLGFLELFNKDFLETLSTDDLCFLHAFWCNRFAKACDNFYSAYSAIDSLDLWQDIIDEKNCFNLKDKDLVVASQKTFFINKLLSETFNIHQSNIAIEERKGNRNTSSLTKNYTSYYTQLGNLIGKDYTNYFSYRLNTKHDFLKDVSFAAPFMNLKMYAYHKKTTTLVPLIKRMMDKPYVKNWGIIRNELEDGYKYDSINAGRSMVLVAFDVQGFNMPFRFHIGKDLLQDLAQSNNPNCLVPEYQGADDFIVNSEIIPSNIIMPIPKRHKKIIMENANSDCPNKNLWEHFYFLMNGKFPNHLMETVQKGKNKSIFSRLPIHYTNLKTGKQYLHKNNKFIELEDSYDR